MCHHCKVEEYYVGGKVLRCINCGLVFRITVEEEK